MAGFINLGETGYGAAGASHTKRGVKAFNAISGSPQSDIDFNNYTLRQRCRMLYMSAPVATSAINTNRTKMVGIGLQPSPSVDRDILGLTEEQAIEWQRRVNAEWKMFAEDKNAVDALGLNNFYELEQIVVKSWLMSGDVFAVIKREEATPLHPYTLRLQLIEADRVSTPASLNTIAYGNTTGKAEHSDNLIYDGVEVNAGGRVVAYYISDKYPDEMPYNGKDGWTRVKAIGDETGLPNILHIMEAERADQYRGVSILAPVIEMVLQMRRYTEAELTAAIIQSYLTAWITKNTVLSGGNPLAGGDIEGVDADSVPKEEAHGYTEQQMGPGNVLVLEDGEDVKFGEPNIPTAGFESFIKTLSKLCGAAMEMPYDVLIKEFNSSYSSAKGALEEAWETIKMRRAHLVSDFCKPVYEMWLAEAVASGRINAPGFFTDPLIRKAWCGARWDGPAQIHLDPTKEAEANEKAVAHGWKTNEQIAREQYGTDWRSNAERLKQENKLMAQVNPAPIIEKGDDDNAEDA